jgi:hypothetical protein
MTEDGDGESTESTESSGGSLKSGTGDLPWEDEDEDDDQDAPNDPEPAADSRDDTAAETTETRTTDQTADTTTTESMSTDATDESPAADADEQSTDNAIPHTDGPYPYLLARDSVSDGRDAATLQLPISAETKKIYNRVIFELNNERFDGVDIQNTDVGIAAMLVGLEYVDEVEEVLREWGYGIEP